MNRGKPGHRCPAQRACIGSGSEPPADAARVKLVFARQYAFLASSGDVVVADAANFRGNGSRSFSSNDRAGVRGHAGFGDVGTSSQPCLRDGHHFYQLFVGEAEFAEGLAFASQRPANHVFVEVFGGEVVVAGWQEPTHQIDGIFRGQRHLHHRRTRSLISRYTRHPFIF